MDSVMNPLTPTVEKKEMEMDEEKEEVGFMSLPAEVHLKIFEMLARDIDEESGNPVPIEYSVESIRKKDAYFDVDDLDSDRGPEYLSLTKKNGLSICRTLRPIAITAFYKSNILLLRVLEDPKETVNPYKKPENFIRFGKLARGFQYYDENGIPRLNQDMGLVGEKIPEKIQQYALKLPPSYVRPHIRNIKLRLRVPSLGDCSGVSHGDQTHIFPPAIASPEIYSILDHVDSLPCTAMVLPRSFRNEDSDWMRPLFSLFDYGFNKVRKITVEFEVWHLKDDDKGWFEGFEVFVMLQVVQDQKLKAMLLDRSLELRFPKEALNRCRKYDTAIVSA